MKTAKLVRDFIIEAYKDKLYMRNEYIEKFDINNWYEEKCILSQTLRERSESTSAKLKQVIMKILQDSGLVIKEKDRYKIVRPLLKEKYISMLDKNGDLEYAKAIGGLVMKNINTRLQEMTNKLSSNELFESNGLGNEINFHVFDYDPEDEYIVREYLENYLLKKSKLNIKVFDIYEIIIDILKEKGFLEKCFDYEQKKGAKYLNTIISKTIGIGSSNDLIMKRTKNEVEPNQIVIITGIGKCYGIVRGHTILNNLHSVITNNPLIMFYPGSYNGQSFKLFNKLENDNYYRAFQFVGRK